MYVLCFFFGIDLFLLEGLFMVLFFHLQFVKSPCGIWHLCKTSLICSFSLCNSSWLKITFLLCCGTGTVWLWHNNCVKWHGIMRYYVLCSELDVGLDGTDILLELILMCCFLDESIIYIYSLRSWNAVWCLDYLSFNVIYREMLGTIESIAALQTCSYCQS